MAARGDFAASSDEVNWRAYLAEFHRERAGIAEAVLSRALAGDHSPYRWLARAVSANAGSRARSRVRIRSHVARAGPTGAYGHRFGLV